MPLLLTIALAFAVISGTPDPRLEGYRVAPGFQLAIAATEPMVINPVTMTWAPDGRLFVIEWKEGRELNDHIKILSDTDGDGVFDKVEMYMDKLDLPAGICFWDGWTYVTLDHDIVRFHDPDLDGKYDRKEVIVSGFGNDNSHHRVSGITIGPDGWLYATTGDSDCHAKGTDGSTATILRCGGVVRCKPDGSKLEVVAFGMRNPWGNVAFDDEFRIFHTDNDNEGSPGFTGCRLLHVVEGGDYGWRLREGARCCQPDFERATWNGGRPGRLGWIAETGRGAPAGLCVLNSAAFPPSTRNLLVYPDVFRKLVRAYKLKPKGATFEVEKEFELLASDNGLFRPTDAEIGPDGALYILDWRTDSGGAGKLSGNGTTGRIYRITWGGTAEEPMRKTLYRERITNIAAEPREALILKLKGDDYGYRRAAMLELIRRGLHENEKAEAAPRPDEAALGLSIARFDLIVSSKDLPKWTRPPLEDLWVHTTIEALKQDKFDATYLYCAYDPNQPTMQRSALEIIGRFADRGDKDVARSLLLTKAADLSENHRAKSLALSRFSGLPREKPGAQPEHVFFGDRKLREAQQKYVGYIAARALILQEERDNKIREKSLADRDEASKAEFAAIFEKRREKNAAELKVVEETIATLARDPAVAADPITNDPHPEVNTDEKKYRVEYECLSTDFLARCLLREAEKAPVDDIFLRDGITRGLDRLGPGGIDTLKKAINSNDPKHQAVAIFALQGCRSPEAMNAILDLIDPPAKSASLPPGADAEFFRTLREFGPAVPPARVVAFLKAHADTEPDACVWAIRVLAAMSAKSASEVGPILPDLLRSKNGEVRTAALNLAASSRSDAAKMALLDLVKDPEHSSNERKLALTALRGYEDKSLAPTLEKLYGTSKDAAFSSELLRVLGSMDFSSAAKFAESALSSPDSTLRSESIALLGQKPDTALIVANLYNAGKLPPEDLARVIEAVRNHSTPELQAAMQVILKDKLLKSPSGAEAKKLRDFVAKNGNPERGKSIYLDARKGNCSSCHRMEGSGGAVGPDLTRVWQTLSFDKRVESILEPSKEIKEGYNTVKVETKDGRVSVGLLVSSTADAVVLRDAQAKEIRIPASEIEQKANDSISLMPAGVVGHLSFAELADLLSFLGDQKAQESLKGK